MSFKLNESLSGISLSMLIPLWARSEDFRSENILKDHFSAKFANDIEFDFESFNSLPGYTVGLTKRVITARTIMLDNLFHDYLKFYDKPVVFNLGCGMQSRPHRLIGKYKAWYDVDFPEVVELNRNVQPSLPNRYYIESDIMDEEWLLAAENEKNVLLMAEGILMYFSPEKVKEFFKKIEKRLLWANFFLEVLGAGAVGYKHPMMKKIGKASPYKWGIDYSDQIVDYADLFMYKSEHNVLDFKTDYIGSWARVATRFPFLKRHYGTTVIWGSFVEKANELTRSLG